MIHTPKHFLQRFVYSNPVLELKKQGTPQAMSGKDSGLRKRDSDWPLVEALLAEENKPKTNGTRERSKTQKSIATTFVSNSVIRSREDTKLGDDRFLKKRNFVRNSSSSTLTAKLVISQSATRPEVSFTNRDRKANASRRILESCSAEKMDDDLTALYNRRKSETASKPNLPDSRKLSISRVATENYSIASIVKARSLAMKWYGKSDMAEKRKQRKGQNALPTINDNSTKLSLCAKVQCSPQFAEVIKLLGEDAVADTTGNVRVLKLK